MGRPLIMYSMTRSGHNFVRLNLMDWVKHLKFINEETQNPIMFSKKYANVKNSVNVVLVRDLMDWLASYLKIILNEKTKEKRINKVYEFIKMWVLISQEAFGETNHIPNKVVIVYDLFVRSKEYRENICEQIGGKYNEKHLNKVPKNGNYSSFDGNKFANKGNQMEIEKRYEFFIGHEYEHVYRDVLKVNEEAVNLYKKYFDISPEKLNILNLL